MRILQDTKEIKRIVSDTEYKNSLHQFRIIRNQTNLEQYFEDYLYYMANIDDFSQILANPNYGHRVEKVLYAYFISSKKRLMNLWKLSTEYDDMFYILKNLYLHAYLFTCKESWNSENYSELMNLQLNSLFSKQMRLLEHIGNTDTRIQEYVDEQLNITDEREKNIRNFNKKYLRDGMASLMNRYVKIYFMLDYKF